MDESERNSSPSPNAGTAIAPGAAPGQPLARRGDAAGVTERTFYREHMLTCRSMRLDDGRYQARVAISTLGSQRTCAQRFLDLDAFDSHEAAVEHALQAGKEWVDANA
jgi:hypothetical protein